MNCYWSKVTGIFFLGMCSVFSIKSYAQNNDNPFTTDENLPPHITRLTYFGQRADWSHDGKRILFLEKTFGDVYEVQVKTKKIRLMTGFYYHEGYTRALYLANGDILLSGARSFDAKNPMPSRTSNAELWVLDKNLDKPPVPLGTKCSEGPAVSRKHMRIAWTINHNNYPQKLPDGVSQIWMADIVYENGTPKLTNKKLVLDSRKLPFKAGLETQNFRPPDEQEITFSAYGYKGTEVMGVDIKTGKVTDYSDAPGEYDEPEGIFPDGKYTTVECDRQNLKGPGHVDIWKLRLDGSHHMERLTYFSSVPGGKASNPVISDDGRFMAFQKAQAGEMAGVGHGIFIYDLSNAGESH